MIHLALSLAAAISLPRPTGEYRIGTTATLDWVDESRRETAVDDPNSRRHVIAQLWYPTQERRGRDAPYIPALSAYAAHGLDPTGGTMNGEAAARYARVRGNSFLDARPIAGMRFPLILISHGWQATRSDYTILAESLASHGYVVCGVDHAYMGHTAFANGDVTVSTDKQFDSGVAAARYYGADLLFVISALRVSAYGPMIDDSKIGLVGHSSGYGAVREAAIADPTIGAVVDIDGGDKSAEHLRGFTQSLLWIRLARAGPPPEEFLRTNLAPVTMLTVPGAVHGAIMDYDFVFALDDAARATAKMSMDTIVCAVGAFFDSTLRSKGAMRPCERVETQVFPAH